MKIGERKEDGGGGGEVEGGWEGGWEEEVGGLEGGWREGWSEGGGELVGVWEVVKSRLLNEKIDNIHERVKIITDNWEEEHITSTNERKMEGEPGGGAREEERGREEGEKEGEGRTIKEEGGGRKKEEEVSGRGGGGKNAKRRTLNELEESPQILIKNLKWEGGWGGGLELEGGGRRKMDGVRMIGGGGGVRVVVSGGGWLKVIEGEFKNNIGGVVKVTGQAKVRIEGAHFEGNAMEEGEGIGGPCVNIDNVGSQLILISNIFKLNFAFFQSNCVHFSGYKKKKIKGKREEEFGGESQGEEGKRREEGLTRKKTRK